MEYAILTVTTENMTDSQSRTCARQMLDDQMIRYQGNIYCTSTKVMEKSYVISYTMDTEKTNLKRFGRMYDRVRRFIYENFGCPHVVVTSVLR
ncbi:MAG: hypothetical protein LLG05_01405 [Porphyromonadaceae bacterium]|nr:hypothetical protein [Porphyromonadaceae bacterium]